MGNGYGDFNEKAAAFSNTRLNESANNIELTNHFTQTMNQTMKGIMPEWPSTMKAPMMNAPMPNAMPPPPAQEANSAPPPPGTPPLLQFSIIINGQTHGPYDTNVLAQMAGTGQINAKSMVWRQGMTAWQSADTVPELTVLFTGAVPSVIPIPPPAE